MTDSTSATNGLEAPLLAPTAPVKKDNSRALLISFLLMVLIGLGNKIFQVLQFIPMFNYPLFNNLLTSFIYLPTSFAYIIPMMKWGKAITPEQRAISQWKFFVMGGLDAIAGIMQSLGVNFLQNGSLVILLFQAAIPISMVISRVLLQEKYKHSQFVGAFIVAAGLVTVLLPKFVGDSSSTGSNPVLWAGLLIFSCVPMCLSSVYKQKALGEVDVDPIYLNGWIAVWQFLLSLPLLIPSAPLSDVAIADIPQNLYDGWLCFTGVNSKLTGTDPDDCSMGPVYVPIYLVFNLGYNILIILILKYGSANILWLALTIMVPMGNVSFALDFMPKSRALQVWDIVGLIMIMMGLFCYRFWNPLMKWRRQQAKSRRNINSSFEAPQAVTVAPAISADGWPVAVTVPGAEVVVSEPVRRASGGSGGSRHSSRGTAARGGDKEYRDVEDMEGGGEGEAR